MINENTDGGVAEERNEHEYVQGVPRKTIRDAYSWSAMYDSSPYSSDTCKGSVSVCAM